MELSEIDRLEMDLLLAQWELWERQLATVQERIEVRQQRHPTRANSRVIRGKTAPL